MADEARPVRDWLFSACDDNGGPLNSLAYYAGVLMSECDRVLHQLSFLQPCGLVEAKVVMPVPIELLGVIDLLAMECGFTSDFTGPEGDENDIYVTFTLGRDPDTIIDPSDLDHP